MISSSLHGMLIRSAALAIAATLATLVPAAAQDAVLPGMPAGIGKTNGVFHGNYCGVGDNGPGLPPTDALDEACMHHDACTPTGHLPSCACNAAFRRETHAVSVSPDQPEELKALAGAVEAAIPVIPCDGQ